MTRQGFRPSAALIRAAENLFLCMAVEQQVRPTVEAYEGEILAKHQFKPAAKWLDHLEAGKIIDRKSSYLLSEEDAKTYYNACFAARDAAGLKVSAPDNCPLLEAENARMQAENALIAELGKLPGLEPISKGFMTQEMRTKVVDTGLRLVAPFVKDASGILKRIVGSEGHAAAAAHT